MIRFNVTHSSIEHERNNTNRQTRLSWIAKAMRDAGAIVEHISRSAVTILMEEEAFFEIFRVHVSETMGYYGPCVPAHDIIVRHVDQIEVCAPDQWYSCGTDGAGS